MRKNVFKMSAFALMLALAGCSNDEITTTTTQGGEEVLLANEDVIEISLTNTSSRNARPVGSSAADNNVDKVEFKFYESTDGTSWSTSTASIKEVIDNSGATYSDAVLTYKTADEAETVPGTDDSYSKKVRLKMQNLTANKKYRIVAYGYNTNFPYGTISEDETTKGLLKTGSFTESTNFSVEEVFAGYVDVKTKETVAKFTTTPRIVLERQVAGMLAYFKNVPVYLPDATGALAQVVKVVVKANAKSTGFQFPAALMSANNDLNGLNTSESATTLLTFTISGDNATNFSNAQEGDTYVFSKGNNKYVLADGMDTPDNLKLLDNTLFGGRFILPYASHVNTSDATLIVELQSGSGVVLRTLKVKTDQPVSGNAYNYDIRCNNFYSIGQKLATDDTTGGEGENPDPDPENPDEPVDLSATDEITVTINDAWDVLHNMDVE